MKSTPDFTNKTIEILAKRAGQKCSFPQCNTSTSAAHSNSNEAINLGEACHIQGARPGSPRYNSNMTNEDRAKIENGIWLCRTHAKKIDNDENKYTMDLLLKWKSNHEDCILKSSIKSDNTSITIIEGEHTTRGIGIVTGLKTSKPVTFKPGTKINSEGLGIVTGIHID